jgi:hypothetical protein
MGVAVGEGVTVTVGVKVGVGVSTAGWNGVGVYVLFGSNVTVAPSAEGTTLGGAAQPLIRISRGRKSRQPRANFKVEVLVQWLSVK